MELDVTNSFFLSKWKLEIQSVAKYFVNLKKLRIYNADEYEKQEWKTSFEHCIVEFI